MFRTTDLYIVASDSKELFMLEDSRHYDYVIDKSKNKLKLVFEVEIVQLITDCCK